MKNIPENIVISFADMALNKGGAICLKYKKGGIWHTLSWDEVLLKVKLIAAGLKQLGVKKGDKISILSNTRYEWTLTDMAILSLGAVTVPVYQSTLADEAQHILNDSAAKIVFVEDKNQLAKVMSIKGSLKKLEKIILFNGKSTDANVLTLKELNRMGEDKIETDDFSTRIQNISRDDLATLVYTSGTTGMPKGVMIIHDNIVKEIDAMKDAFDLSDRDESILFLPLAHILARAVQFFQLSTGFIHAYGESIDHLIENIKEIKPTFIVSVPRIFEKIYNKVMTDVDNASLPKKCIFNWAVSVGKKVGEAARIGASAGLIDRMLYLAAHQLVFAKLHERLGGRLRFSISGGAPLGKEVAEFFNAAGILILEGYGLTETTGATNINMIGEVQFGSVGRTINHCEQKIAPDGEILVRGGMVFKGYYNNPQATEEAFSNGWFKTGDIGEFTPEGHLRITDRKKDIIVTAAGKNVAPQNIENIIKTESVISQVVVHGDKRKYLSALITLNEPEIKKIALSQGVESDDFVSLISHPKIYAWVKKLIDNKNKLLPSYETIKKFAILPSDFTVESGELTPSLKVKRKVVSQKYKEILDSFYAE